ncbi:MAG TPA: hypothetical protein VG273_05275 [Bryobacteraceae bacterium]|nr:hypothetical protein [Bryobacteraceae bacterium]
MSKSKLSAFLTLLLVFASGAVLGAVAHRLYVVNTVATGTSKRPSPEDFRKRQVGEMRDRVKMDDNQVASFNQILDQTKARFDDTHKQYNAANRAIWDEQRNKVRAILRPDQVALFDQLMADHDAARKQHERDRDKK